MEEIPVVTGQSCCNKVSQTVWLEEKLIVSSDGL